MFPSNPVAKLRKSSAEKRNDEVSHAAHKDTAEPADALVSTRAKESFETPPSRVREHALKRASAMLAAAQQEKAAAKVIVPCSQLVTLLRYYKQLLCAILSCFFDRQTCPP